jgi:peptidoglycan/xylan/chitin deacetylase (PgdA/CDA1 family)
MGAMGHVIGAHNDAHLDLGRLTDPDAIRGEIDRALEGVAALTGHPCRDFAVSFGRPRHFHPLAIEHLRDRGVRTYACVRGLNVPGRTPRLLLRDQIELTEPWLFQRACLDGAVDRRWAREVGQLDRLGGRLPG